MATSPWVVEIAGPPRTGLARSVRVAGGPALLAVLVEVWGAGPRRDDLAGRLAAGIASAFERQTGGTTARLKAALAGADDWLRRVRAAPGPAWGPADGFGAGVSVLVATPGEVILAQAGPALAFAMVSPPDDPGGAPRPARFPAASPWLRRDVAGLADHPLWPPLGVPRPVPGRAGAAAPGRPLEIHWSSWRPVPGYGALLAPTTAAPALTREVVARLLGGAAAPGPDAAAPGLATAIGADVPGVLVRPRRPPPVAVPPIGGGARTAAGPVDGEGGHGAATSADHAGAPGTHAGAAAIAGQAAATRPAHAGRARAPGAPGAAGPGAWVSAARPVARAAAAGALGLARLGLFHAARLGARVVVALFPNRSVDGPDAGPADGTRLAMAAAVGLPVAVVALALMMRARLGPAIPAAAPAPAAVPEAVLPAAGDALAGIIRLGGVQPVANLPGAPGDDRRLVAAAGVPYVLDAGLDQVDRVVGGVAEPVLRKGQPVGSAVVGALVDLFWLPPAGNGPEGRVVAMDAAGALWSVGGASAAAVPRAALPGWIGVDQAAGFDGRLYALDRSTGQVYRYAPDAAGGFSADGQPWLDPAQNLAGALDVALDGALYVLDRDGRIAKYAGGSAVRFAIEGLDPPLSDARAVYASATAGRLLVADRGHGRIVALSPEGRFVAQLLRPAQPLADPPDTGRFADLHDVWWDEPNQMLYVAAGVTLYAAPYGR